MDETTLQSRAKPATKKPGDLSEYNLENYDEEDINEAELGPFTNIKGLTYYRNNDEDPYITLKDVSLSFCSPGVRNFTYFDADRTTKMSEKSSRFYPQTIWLSSRKLKTKSLNWRSMSTTNLKRTFTPTTT